ncbi:hypothetical protein C8J57DRAFT_1235801 [Mycena rebaudengoi]|nr:hypothetical protein C8J57DRAFT_1235801 [Mycena rebaudengoi]
MDAKDAAAKPPVAPVTGAAPVKAARKGETIELAKLITLVGLLTKNFAGGFGFRSDSHLATVAQVDHIPASERYTLASKKSRARGLVKGEDSERYEGFMNDIAELKGVNKIQTKGLEALGNEIKGIETRVVSSVNGALNSFKQSFTNDIKHSLNLHSQGDAPAQDSGAPNDLNNQKGQPNNSGQYNNSANQRGQQQGRWGQLHFAHNQTDARECFYCGQTGHMVQDCEYKREHIDAGKVKVEDGRLRLGDGSMIPGWPKDRMQKQKVDDYYGSKTVPGAQTISMLAYCPPTDATSATFLTELGDAAGTVYDTAGDELRTFRVQKYIKERLESAQPAFLQTFNQNNASSIDRDFSEDDREFFGNGTIFCCYKESDQAGKLVGPMKEGKARRNPKLPSARPPKGSRKADKVVHWRTEATRGSSVEINEEDDNEEDPAQSDDDNDNNDDEDDEKSKEREFKPIVEVLPGEKQANPRNLDDRELEQGSDDDDPELPFGDVPEVNRGEQLSASQKKKKTQSANSKEKAYELVAPMEERSRNGGDLMDRLLDNEIPVKTGDLICASPSIARRLKGEITKRRLPVEATRVMLQNTKDNPRGLLIEYDHISMQARPVIMLGKEGVRQPKLAPINTLEVSVPKSASTDTQRNSGPTRRATVEEVLDEEDRIPDRTTSTGNFWDGDTEKIPEGEEEPDEGLAILDQLMQEGGGELGVKLGYDVNGELQIEGYLQPRNGKFMGDEQAMVYINASKDCKGLWEDVAAASLFQEFTAPVRDREPKASFQGT